MNIISADIPFIEKFIGRLQCLHYTNLSFEITKHNYKKLNDKIIFDNLTQYNTYVSNT